LVALRYTPQCSSTHVYLEAVLQHCGLELLVYDICMGTFT
jgi:hypothetical protein